MLGYLDGAVISGEDVADAPTFDLNDQQPQLRADDHEVWTTISNHRLVVHDAVVGQAAEHGVQATFTRRGGPGKNVGDDVSHAREHNSATLEPGLEEAPPASLQFEATFPTVSPVRLVPCRHFASMPTLLTASTPVRNNGERIDACAVAERGLPAAYSECHRCHAGSHIPERNLNYCCPVTLSLAQARRLLARYVSSYKHTRSEAACGVANRLPGTARPQVERVPVRGNQGGARRAKNPA
jgi:hypothetical protein